jgi:UDP-glucose 4-epimerase
MKKILVTGGAGFIGSHTCVELFAAGYLPVVVDNFSGSDRRVKDALAKILGMALPVYEIDCCDAVALREVFRKEGPIEGAIHFAAYKSVGASVNQPLEYYANNLGSLVTLLQVMREENVRRFVFSSSCTVYGQPDELPVTEESPMKPAESPYGRTKQFCEAVINDAVTAKIPLQATSLRYFNPVGAHPSALIGELPIGKPENLVPFITQSAAGWRGELTVFGNDYSTRDGTCVRDYIHVVDLARAHVAAMRWLENETRPAFNEIFNLGTGNGVTVLEAIAAFEQASGTKLKYKLGARRPGDVMEVYASVEKATRLLGWRTELTILEAMRDAHRWQTTLGPNPPAA